MSYVLLALIKKEFLQIIRDPSSILIAFVLPILLLILYMFAVNMDTVKINLGIKNDDPNIETTTLVDSFGQNKYVNAFVFEDKNLMYEKLTSSKLKGAIIIPNDFSTKLSNKQNAKLLIITDGSEVNPAKYVQMYPQAIVNQWLLNSKYRYNTDFQNVNFETRFWYNQDINSHHFILPGSLGITMTLVGMLLTALVVAREWERGTMEAILSTNVSKIEIVLGKYIPYFFLGMGSICFCYFVSIFVFQIPFRGNFFILLIGSALFLLTCLGNGLLISTIFKDQFLASQAAIAIGFLPALMFSGLIYPINSMPLIFQILTKIFPPRYFVSFVQSEFLTGTIWQIVFNNFLYLFILATILFFCVYFKTSMNLEISERKNIW